MCGLVGMIARTQRGFFYKDIDIFDQLLYVDALRGQDSTGITTVEFNGDFHIDKEASEAALFAYSYNKMTSHNRAVAHGSALLGHNRKSTVGKTTDETAHPFVINNQFAFMHNGTLTSHRQIANTEVDSEALGILLEETINDAEYDLDMLGKALDRVYGAYACVWYNQVKNEVQFLRNSQRPLFIAETSDMWFYASEPTMLQWILSRNDVTGTTLFKVEEDTLYTMVPGGDVPYKKESVPVKKYTQAPTVVSTNVSGGVGTDNQTMLDELPPVTKAEFKKARGSWVGKSINFSVYDYVEAHPNAPRNDYIVFGFSDELNGMKHILKGPLNVQEQQIYSIEYVDHYDFQGVISSISYNKSHNQVEFQLTGIKQTSFTQNETTTALH